MSEDTARALEHGDDAAGARYRREGFAWTAEDDLAFALGWPHMVRLVDDQEDPADAARELATGYPATRDWPRLATHRLLRAMGAGRKGPKLSPKAEEALTVEAAVSEDEGVELLRSFLACSWTKRLQPLFGTYAFEAVLGPSLVAETVVSTFEHDPKPWLDRRAPICNFITQCGVHLLRVPEKEAQALRLRLHALLETHAETVDLAGPPNLRGLRKLDLVLHGRKGAERSGHVVDGFVVPYELHNVLDDADYVFEQAKGIPPDASSVVDGRIAFLAGERWLTEEKVRWPKYKQPKPGVAHLQVIDQIGRIQSDVTLEILLAMAAMSKAKKDAAQWFIDHAEQSRAFLAGAAGAEHGATASKLLKKLG